MHIPLHIPPKSLTVCASVYIISQTLEFAIRTLPSRNYGTLNRLIPIIGSILVGVWKVNLRNAAVLEEFLRVRGEESLKGGGQPATV